MKNKILVLAKSIIGLISGTANDSLAFTLNDIEKVKENALQIIIELESHPSDNTKLIEAAKRLLRLHACEQEGIASGQPTNLQWLLAVNELEQALRDLEKKL